MPLKLPRLSVASALTVSFTALVLVAVALVLWISVGTGFESSLRLLRERSETNINTLVVRTRAHLDPAMAQIRHLARMVETEALDPSKPDQLRTALSASLAAAPQIDSVVYIDIDLQAMLMVRTPNGGTKAVSRNWSASPLYQHYARELARADGAFWGDFAYVAVRLDSGEEGTFLNARIPVRRDGEMIGAFVGSVAIAQLSRFLAGGRGPTDTHAFVLSGQDQVIAHRELADGVSERSEDEPLHPVAKLRDPVLKAFLDEQRRERIPVGADANPDYEFYRVQTPNGSHYLVQRWLYGYGAVPWLVGAHTASEVVEASLDSLLDAAVAGALVLLVALVVAVLGARSLSQPVKRLGAAANTLARLGPEAVPALPPSHIIELDTAGRAFNNMLDGLRQRELMRAAFGKFVPAAIADSLIESPNALAPVTREATALFTDIAGFSALAEEMPPEQLILLLNEYFSALIEPIEHYGGVIQQFQGDAILATFNLPVSDDSHAANALYAALAIESLQQRPLTNGVRLTTRIGLNSGHMVGGTVGGAGRLGYTVHGDAVNLAARVQDLNKQYGTHLLLSERTAALAGDIVPLREVGTTAVRGRRRPVTLYTPT